MQPPPIRTPLKAHRQKVTREGGSARLEATGKSMTGKWRGHYKAHDAMPLATNYGLHEKANATTG